MATAALKKKAGQVLEYLEKKYPHSKGSLAFENPFQLLVATILSAQCTDERVNRVTPGLFRKYPTPAALAAADPQELEREIRPAGFYRNKARNLKACARKIAEEFGGQVPPVLESLVKLPGVGRKTANVVLGNAFGIPAVAVETHVIRIAGRLGLTAARDPAKIEVEFMEIFPKKDWVHLTHLFIDFGRSICKAPTPKCGLCGLTQICTLNQKYPFSPTDTVA